MSVREAEVLAVAPTKGLLTYRGLASQARVWGLVATFFAWEGVVGAFVGNYVTHRMLIAAAIFGFAALRLIKIGSLGKISLYEAASYGLYLFCIVISWYSNTFVYPQPWNGWIPAIYSITPILLLPALKFLGFRAEEILKGLFYTGVAASLVVVADQFVHIRNFDVFIRGASAGVERRMIFLKTESACALIILFALTASTNDLRKRIIYGGLLIPVVINLVIVTESRLAMAAVGIAAAITVAFAFKGVRRAQLILAASLLIAALGPLLFTKYIEQAMSYGNYVADDVSVAWRVRTLDLFFKAFETTNGLGFGVMSSNAEWSNPIAWAFNYASVYAEAGRYPISLGDIAITAALVQFGYLGVVIVIIMTIVMGWRFIVAGRMTMRKEVFALGSLIFGYLISPLPMNFFTLEWTAITGNVLWALAAMAPTLRAANDIADRTGPIP